MKSVQQEVDERSNLTGTNKFELLLFRLGGDENGEHSELFGINVFKVREIVAVPAITKVAGSPEHSAGTGTGMVTSIARLPAEVDQPARLAQVLDVETILCDRNPEANSYATQNVGAKMSGTTNEEHVNNVRADAYVARFSAEDPGRTLRTLLKQ